MKSSNCALHNLSGWEVKEISKIKVTRMYSSRIRTVCCSGHLGAGGKWWGGLPGVYLTRGVAWGVSHHAMGRTTTSLWTEFLTHISEILPLL